MPTLQTLLVTYGVLLVFGGVLLQQAGLPIPTSPLLVSAGALCAQGALFWPVVLLACVLACLIADSGWYWAGRRYGGRLLGRICRVSLSPDSCVRQTQQRYQHTGPRLLLVARFLPGASALAIVMAGQNRTPLRRFLPYDVAGAALWAGTALTLGAVFSRQVGLVLDALDRWGRLGLLTAAAALAAYIGWRWVRRRHMRRRLSHIPRLPAAELLRWQTEGRDTVLIDVRPNAPARLPGARSFNMRHPITVLELDPAAGHDIVVYCACPHEISAALLAERLLKAGFERVWALEGGYEAAAAPQAPSATASSLAPG
jgi:membrane protein DedA with SNARE-associated domain/rhodanese-related sulfurtransferase